MTIIGHALSGICGVCLLRSRQAPRPSHRLLLAAAVIPCLPDLDVLSFAFGIPYDHTFGHRGFSHSVACGLIAGLLAAGLLLALGRLKPTMKAFARIVALVATLWSSHGVFDMMTDGGRGVLFFYPMNHQRIRAPVSLIPVAPVVGLGPTSAAALENQRSAYLRKAGWQSTLPRAFVRLSDKPGLARPLFIIGVAVHETFFLAALAALVAAARHIPSLPLGAALLAICLAAGEAYHLWIDRSFTMSRERLRDAHATAYVALRPRRPVIDGAVILLHGWRCSAAMMLPLARMLARNGMPTLVPDLPGHGRSPVSLEARCLPEGALPADCTPSTRFLDAGESALAELVAGESLEGKRLALIGHSLGSRLAHRAMDTRALHRSRSPIVAVVNLEGGFSRSSTNMLLVGRKAWLQRLRDPPPSNREPGAFANRAAFQQVPREGNHLSLLHDAQVNFAILDWLGGAFGRGIIGDPRTLYSVYVSSAICLAGLALLAIATLPPRLGGGTTAAPWRTAALALLLLTAGAACARFPAAYLPTKSYAFRWLEHERLLLPPYLLGAAWAPALVAAALASRRVPRGEWGPALATGGIAALILYATVGWYADRHLFHLFLTVQRLPRLLAFALTLAPVAALRLLLPTASPPGRYIMLMGTWAALLAAWCVGQPDAIRRECVAMLALIALVEIFALALENRTGSAPAAAAFTGLAVAWLLASAYPVLAGPV